MGSAAASHQTSQQEALARLLLDEVDELTTAAQRRAEYFAVLRERFGFQRDSISNQREHLTSIIVSYMSRGGNGDYDEAVTDLHTKMLRPVEAWRDAVTDSRQTTWRETTVGAESLGAWLRPVAARAESSAARGGGGGGGEEEEGRVEGEEVADLFTKAALHTRRDWVQLTTVQMEHEIILYLCIWGEAGMLRFCPELRIRTRRLEPSDSLPAAPTLSLSLRTHPLRSHTFLRVRALSCVLAVAFLFELARSWEPNAQLACIRTASYAAAAGGSGDAAAADDEPPRPSRVSVPDRAVMPPRPRAAHAATPNEFLERVLKPLYAEVYAERYHRTRTRPCEKRNYDDLNESFWQHATLARLRTRPEHAGGKRVMAEPPSRRYEALLHADWPSFFRATVREGPQAGEFRYVRKTHREFRWWGCLLAANRRIFLLHGLSFGVTVTVVMSARYNESTGYPIFDFNGWRSWRLLPVLLLLPFASKLYGRLFALWANPSEHTRARLTTAVAFFALAVALCTLSMALQVHRLLAPPWRAS